MRVAMGIVLALSFIPAPALAEPVVVESDKIICKRNPQSYDTGSRVAKRRKICMSASQWKAREEQTEQNVREANERSNIAPPAPADMTGAPTP